MFYRFLNDDTRQIAFAMCQFLCFGIITTGFALRNQPDAVEYIGAAITVIVLLQITGRRNNFLDAAASWEKARIWAYLKYLEEKNRHRDEALHLTFDLHMVQIAQMCVELDLPCPMCDMDDDRLRELGSDVQRRLDAGETFTANQDATFKSIADFESDAKAVMTSSINWARYFGKLELILGIWGAMQSAVGGQDCYSSTLLLCDDLKPVAKIKIEMEGNPVNKPRFFAEIGTNT